MENFSIPLLKKSLKFIKNHKKGIGAAALTGAVIAAVLIKKKNNKSNHDLRSYGIKKTG